MDYIEKKKNAVGGLGSVELNASLQSTVKWQGLGELNDQKNPAYRSLLFHES